ncbi:MAG: helix-turn-helix transcriptional regulator [Ekhidna sp.]
MKIISQVIVQQRKKKLLSQEELAHKSGISLRTIQRIEKGSVNPHGHTLKVLAETLEFDLTDLIKEKDHDFSNELRTLNAIGLLAIIAPLIHLFVQLFYWKRKKVEGQYKTIGRRILSFQIIWLLATLVAFSLIHILSFIIAGQSVIGHFPYRLITYMILLLINVSLVGITAVRLNSNRTKILTWVPLLL